MTFSFFQLISTIGIAAVLGAFLYIGKKLQILEDLCHSIKKIKTNLNVVVHYLTRHHAEFNPAELKTLSPIQLTPQGSSFIKEIGFENIFQKHKQDFFNFIDNEHPKAKYDVESAAIKSMYVLYEKPFMQFLKVYLYNHPDRTLENTAPTLGVYVRDAYLEKHPEITE